MRKRYPLSLTSMTLVLIATSSIAQTTAAQRLPRLREVSQLGCVSCGDPRLLSNVLSLSVGSDGSVYVIDVTRPHLRHFGNGGRLLSTGVMAGRDPGQAVLPIAIIDLPPNLHIVDMELARLTSMTGTGQVLTVLDLPGSPVAVAHRKPHNHFFFATIDYTTTPLTSTIWRLDLNNPRPQRLYTSTDGFPRGRDGSPATFFAFAMTPSGGFALGEGAYAYRIRELDRDGMFVRDIERQVPRTRMTEVEHQRALERRRMALGRIKSLARIEGGDPGPMGALPLEENYFSAAAIRYDDIGRIWVKTDRGSASETIFDVFAPGGDLMGEVKTTDALGVFDITGNYLAATGFGRFDAPIVRMYEILSR